MPDYKRIYEEVWSHEEYRQVNHGLNLWRGHRDLFPDKFVSVMDFGCGNGQLVRALLDENYEAYGFDIAENAMPDHLGTKWVDEKIFIAGDLRYFNIDRFEGSDFEPFDLGVCCDVMEHIDEADVPAVLANIWGLCNQVIFVIANHKSEFLGYDLHPTRKSPWWWWQQMFAVERASRVKVQKIVRPGRDGVFSLTWKRSK